MYPENPRQRNEKRRISVFLYFFAALFFNKINLKLDETVEYNPEMRELVSRGDNEHCRSPSAAMFARTAR